MSPHLPPTACIIAFAVIVAVLVLGFIAIALDDWAGKAIARHVERALNEGERPTIDPYATPIADAALRHVIATRAELAAGARAEDFGGGR